MTQDADAQERRTWHYGLIARWWAEFNRDGDDIAYFRRLIEQGGQPALDLCCGAGRLLLPYRRAGLDVDGCDVSADMIAHCREAALKEGLEIPLHVQAIHELALPRRYRTIVICGSFGIGGTRQEDLEGLRRVHEHLLPGGLLAFDLFLPNFDRKSWGAWLPKNRRELPMPWPERSERRQAADGSELELRGRVFDFDPLNQVVTRQLRAEHWRDGELISREEGSLSINIYFKSEVVLMLQAAGFDDIQVKAGLTDEDARPWEHSHLVFTGRK